MDDDLEEYHITLIWGELKERFGFDIKKWKQHKFPQFLRKQPRGVSEIDAFYRFGNDFINPLLNDILGRPPAYPTFNNLVNYIVKKSRKA